MRPAGKGKRLIIVHAISIFGLAFANEADGERPQPSEFDSDVFRTAEMIWRAKSTRGDYHDNIDCDNFLMWLDRRMVHAFRAKHDSDKTLIMVLDNALYHHGRHEDGFFCSEHNKSEIVDKLGELGCERLRVAMTSRKKNVQTPAERPTVASPPAEFIGWYLLDVDDAETFEVTHMAQTTITGARMVRAASEEHRSPR